MIDQPNKPSIIFEWWPIFLGVSVLYVPTFYDLANGLWNSEEHAHGPIVLAVALYFFWQKKDVFLKSAAPSLINQEPGKTKNKYTNPIMGWLSLLFGLVIYAVGRSQEIGLLEVGSLIPVIVGALLCTRGRLGVRALWFPLLFIIFMIPLPGAMAEMLTNPLKRVISEIAEIMLYWAGYPIARSGVVLTVGPYQLLVADACSGLHSMFSLSAMGLLYLYQMHYRNAWRNGILLASVLPIAFVANVIRVMVIILVTYHMGDEAGQGFIHGFAGIFLFVVSLMFLFLLDNILGRISIFRDKLQTPACKGS